MSLLAFNRIAELAVLAFIRRSRDRLVRWAMHFPEFHVTEPGTDVRGMQPDEEQLAGFVRPFAWNSCFQWRSGFLLCCWLLFVCVPGYGIDRDRKLNQLYHTAWTYSNGTPGEVHSLAQTTDGFLWLGTATGLYRFDGTRFQQFGHRNVFSLFADPNGGLWVGYWYGGVSVIKNGT